MNFLTTPAATGGMGSTVIMMVLMIAIFYFMLIRPENKRKKEAEQMRSAVRNGDKQVAQITFNDDIINIVAGMLEEKTEFVQTYFANPDFQNFVNARVFQAAVSQLSNR